MIDASEVDKLAKLAQIEMSAEEKVGIGHDLDRILDYVSELKNAPEDGSGEGEHYVKNVMRADDDANTPESYTVDIIRVAPRKDGNYIKVKKIIPQDN